MDFLKYAKNVKINILFFTMYLYTYILSCLNVCVCEYVYLRVFYITPFSL